MPDVVLAPYLPASSQFEVGTWWAIPFQSLEGHDALSDDLAVAVLRLIAAYEVEDGTVRLGVVLFPRGAEIGAPIEPSSLPRLHAALVAGSVANNPKLGVADKTIGNQGYQGLTAENALVWGHPVDDGRSYAIATGKLFGVMSMRTADLDAPLPKIDPPLELPKPMLGSFDHEVAGAALQVIEGEGVEARRLLRALEWCDVALSNADVVSDDVRVESTRSALEVLIGAGDKSKKLVRAVSRLLDEPDAPQATYEPGPPWKGPVQLTERGWWLARFCRLRNAIVHGDEVSADDWVHEGLQHLDLAHDNLIAALLAVIADVAEDPLLTTPRAERAIRRAYEELNRDQ